MNVTFYTFSKRINSTKQPTGGTVKNCKLKDDCSVRNPVIILASSPTLYNYAYIATWSRYYYVSEIISLANGLTEYHLSEDVLASNKSAIGSTKAHILYSSSDYDSMIIDSRIQTKNEKTANYVYTGAGLGGNNYILTVYNNSTTAPSGMSETYFLTPDAMAKIQSWFGDVSVMTAMKNYFGGNPLQAVYSVKWVPYKLPDYPSSLAISVSGVLIGNQQSSNWSPFDGNTEKGWLLNGYPILSNTYSLQCHLRYSDFRKYEPYTTGTLYLPGVGTVDISMGDFKTSTNITIKRYIEMATGNTTYLIMNALGTVVQSASCMLAAPCPIGQQITQGSSMMASMMTVAGGVAALGAGLMTGGVGTLAAIGAGSAIVTGVTNTVLSYNKHAASIGGSLGGRPIAYYNFIDHCEYSVDTEDPDNADYIAMKGRPCNGTRQISALSGYVQCLDAHVSASAPDAELAEIDNFLNSGIYYE